MHAVEVAAIFIPRIGFVFETDRVPDVHQDMADCNPDPGERISQSCRGSAVDGQGPSVRIQEERPQLEARRQEPGMNIEICDRALDARIQRPDRGNWFRQR